MMERETAAGLFEGLLDSLEDPVLIIDERRLVLAQNRSAIKLLRHLRTLKIRDQRLHIAIRNDELALDRLINGAAGGADDSNGGGRGLRSTQPTVGRSWLMVLSPIAAVGVRNDRKLFLLQLVRRLMPRRIPSSVLADLYDLSRQELALINGLARRQSLRQIAIRLNVSHETARVYLKRVFRKCELNSQQELLALLHKLGMFSG